jgi:hypothetical protein
MTQSTDPDAADFEPEVFVPRWLDGSIKPEAAWTEHERGMVAWSLQNRDTHREVVGRRLREVAASKEGGDGTA